MKTKILTISLIAIIAMFSSCNALKTKDYVFGDTIIRLDTDFHFPGLSWWDLKEIHPSEKL